MDAESLIQQFRKLPPEEKRRFWTRVSELPPDDEAATADFDELVTGGILQKIDDLWVITAEVADLKELLVRERERRIQELMGE